MAHLYLKGIQKKVNKLCENVAVHGLNHSVLSLFIDIDSIWDELI